MAFQEVLTNFSFEFNKGKLTAIQKGVGRAVTGLRTMATQSDMFAQRMQGFFSRAKQVVGAYLGFRAVRSITGDYALAADAVAKFSNGLGINAQAYQAMTHAAQLSGVTIQELQVALPNLAKRAGDAADGSKEAALAFSRTGVSVKDAAGKLKDPITLMTELADGLGKMEDQGRRTQILMNLFGRSGKKMGVLLSQGSEGIKKAMDEAKKLGIVLSDEQLKVAENYNDEMLRVKSIMLGIRNAIASQILPVLVKQLRAFQLWWREGNNAERALKTLKTVAIATGVILAKMIAIKTVKSTQSFIKNILSAVKALRAFNLASLITNIQLMLIVAAFALIGLAIEDLVGFVQGKDSIIGRLLGDSETAREVRDILVSIGQTVVKTWRDVKPELLAVWKELKPALADLWKEAKPLIGPAFKAGIFVLINGFRLLAFFIRASSASISFFASAARSGIANIKMVLGPVVSFIASMVKKLERALELLGLISGKATIGPSKSQTEAVVAQARQEAIREFEKPTVTTGPGGEKIITRLTKPVEEILEEREKQFLLPVRPAEIFEPPARGGIGRLPSVTNNTNVSSGAVQLTVVTQATDPREVARETNNLVTERISTVITDASRNIAKPPAGQR